MTEKRIRSMDDLKRMIIENVYENPEDVNVKDVNTITWIVIRDLITRHQWPIEVSNDYKQRPYYLNFKRYYTKHQKLPNFIINRYHDMYKDYHTKSLLNYIKADPQLIANGLFEIDPFKMTHFKQMKWWQLLKPAPPVQLKNIPKLNSTDYGVIKQLSYRAKIRQSNLAIRLYHHIEAVSPNLSSNADKLNLVTLFTLAYIAQDPDSKYNHINIGDQLSYQPQVLMTQTSQSYKTPASWPDSWFIMDSQYRISNPSINIFNYQYSFDNFNGYRQSEFDQYQKVIQIYSNTDFGDFVNDLKDIPIDQTQTNHALDWVTLQSMRLPAIQFNKEFLI